MRIAFYINAINGGGAARVMTVLANRLSELGHEIVFITSYPCEREYPLNSPIRRLNLEAERAEESFLRRNIGRVFKLRKSLKKSAADVLIAFMAEPNLRALAATIGTGVPTVVSVRNDPRREYASFALNVAARLLFKRAAWIVFQTPEACEYFGKLAKVRGSVIPNPVDSIFYRTSWRPQPGLIITCGRLTDQKNQKMLIEAFAKIVKTIPEARLEIYGEGELEQELNDQIVNLGLEGKAILKGYSPNMAMELSRASVFVLPSKYEGMPNVLMEAMAIGVPAVATDCPCGGARYLLKGEMEFLLSDLSKDDLAIKICNLLPNQKCLDRVSVCELKRAQEFTVDKVTAEWLQILYKITG